MSRNNSRRSRVSQPPTRSLHASRSGLIDTITGEILEENFAVPVPAPVPDPVPVPDFGLHLDDPVYNYTPHRMFLSSERNMDRYRQLQVARRMVNRRETLRSDPLNSLFQTGYTSQVVVTPRNPRLHPICQYRRLRRAVLFRQRKIGRGSARRAYPKFNPFSNIRCT